jgi:hypothetical protein
VRDLGGLDASLNPNIKGKSPRAIPQNDYKRVIYILIENHPKR